MKTKITLVRHGQTEWNALGKVQGCADIPLNAKGIQQAKDKADFFENKSYDLAYTSPLSRAKDTLEILMNENKMTIPVYEDDRLIERNFGAYEGKEFTLVRQARATNNYHDSYENDELIITRVMEALSEIADENTGTDILITAHSHVLKAALVAVAPDTYTFNTGLDNLGVCVLEYQNYADTWRVIYEETTGEMPTTHQFA